MEWDIVFSRQTNKFLAQHHLSDEAVMEPIVRAIKKLDGEVVTFDLKRLTGTWTGYFRIRTSKYRIIFSINFDTRVLFVEVFDSRDSSYNRHA